MTKIDLRQMCIYLLKPLCCLLVFIVMITQGIAATEKQPIRIGSKVFAESYILAELAAQLLENNGYSVERVHGLGGTLIVYQALIENEIDIYPEYTGTISQTILKQPEIKDEQFDEAIAAKNLLLSARFGFNNSYAIAISSNIAKSRGIVTISDLAQHLDLSMGFSLEFLNRNDGWPALSKFYQLDHLVRGMEHALAYRAINSGQLAVTDAYTTDGEIDTDSMLLLEDDKHFFPTYYAGLLSRDNLPIGVIKLLNKLTDSIDNNTMQYLNRRASMEGDEPKSIAGEFLVSKGLIESKSSLVSDSSKSIKPIGGDILHNTLTHLKLTVIALMMACLIAIPSALVLSQYPRVARVVMYLSGLVQTIPSLALLALMIPVFGLGEIPAIVALFLYSLLPIFRNTLVGIFTVDPLLKQVATGMGLTVWQKLLKIELPLAVPQLIAGVKTAAIISIGTATLAAFVGAGGLGEPIITGLTLNDHRLILQGAIPAAALAILTEFIFELIERVCVPAHLVNR